MTEIVNMLLFLFITIILILFFNKIPLDLNKIKN